MTWNLDARCVRTAHDLHDTDQVSRARVYARWDLYDSALEQHIITANIGSILCRGLTTNIMSTDERWGSLRQEAFRFGVVTEAARKLH